MSLWHIEAELVHMGLARDCPRCHQEAELQAAQGATIAATYRLAEVLSTSPVLAARRSGVADFAPMVLQCSQHPLGDPLVEDIGAELTQGILKARIIRPSLMRCGSCGVVGHRPRCLLFPRRSCLATKRRARWFRFDAKS